MSIIVSSEKIKLFELVTQLCEYTGHTEDWRDYFWESLLTNEPVYREFLYWVERGDFLLKYKVGGNTIIDILVWEMRKYNIKTDRGKNGADCDKHAMILNAFMEMLNSDDEGQKLGVDMETKNGMDRL